MSPTQYELSHLELKKNNDNLLKHYENALSKQIIKTFLSQTINYEIFLHAICVPTKENEKRLNQSFQRYYVEVRFIHYMSQVIWRYAKDFKAKKNTEQTHYVLLMDQPLQREGTVKYQTYGEQLPDKSNNGEILNEKRSHLLEQIDDPYLYKGLQQLTNKQLRVLNLNFVSQFTHTEIALLLGTSQQAVTKMIGQALHKLRVHFEKRDGYGTDILD